MLKNRVSLTAAGGDCRAGRQYQCSVKPRDDVIISPQSVQVNAPAATQISPDGDVIRNGRALS